MPIKLTQWEVKVEGTMKPMFTLPACNIEEACAIAVATFGFGVEYVRREGSFMQDAGAM